jgi:hypothetical protein
MTKSQGLNKAQLTVNTPRTSNMIGRVTSKQEQDKENQGTYVFLYEGTSK